MCSCLKGCNGAGSKCTDINECAISELNSCHKDADCSNKNGSFKCSCIKGYDGDGIQCQDIDECSDQMRNCHKDANCINTKGLWNCNYQKGFDGNGTHGASKGCFRVFLLSQAINV